VFCHLPLIVRRTTTESGKGMEKEKEKKPEFNLAGYDYMDDMPMEGWIWEFVRRNKHYQEYWDWICLTKDLLNGNETLPDEDRMWGKYWEHFGPINLAPPNRRWPQTYGLLSSHPKRTKLVPVRAVNLGIGVGIDKQYAEFTTAPHPSIRKKVKGNITSYSIPTNYPPVDQGTLGTKTGEVVHVISHPLIQHPIDLLWEFQNQENMIMALIDISSPRSVDHILEELKKALLGWRKRLKLPKTRAPKTPQKNKDNSLLVKAPIWKSYLIVYDLIQKSMSYKDASNFLSRYDADTYGSEKMIERHYKAAIKMINGGYKKYL